MEPMDVARLLFATGVIDKTGAVNVDKMRGSWSIEDGRRGVKYTRTAKGAGADDNQDGKQGGGIG